MKLYTDFDKLQFELKRSFRLESIDDLLEQYTMGLPPMSSSEAEIDIPETMNNDSNQANVDEIFEESKSISQELTQRLQEFYYWRGILYIFINTLIIIII